LLLLLLQLPAAAVEHPKHPAMMIAVAQNYSWGQTLTRPTTFDLLPKQQEMGAAAAAWRARMRSACK
jgi:hypothetical protein